jgi:hypothetical protein
MCAELLLTLTTALKEAMMVVADDITRKRIVFTPTTVALNNLTTSFTKGSIAFYTVLKDSGVLATTVSIHMIADTSDTVGFQCDTSLFHFSYSVSLLALVIFVFR